MKSHSVGQVIMVLAFLLSSACQADTFVGQKDVQVEIVDLNFLSSLGLNVTASEWHEVNGGRELQFKVEEFFDSSDKRIELVMVSDATNEVVLVIQDRLLVKDESFSLLIAAGYVLRMNLLLNPDGPSKYYEIEF